MFVKAIKPTQTGGLKQPPLKVFFLNYGKFEFCMFLKNWLVSEYNIA